MEDRLLQWIDGNGATVKRGYDTNGRVDKRYLSQMGTQGLSIMCTNETFAYDSIGTGNQAKTFQYIWPDSQGPSSSAYLHVQVDWATDPLGRKLGETLGYGDSGDPLHSPSFSKLFTSTWSFGSGKEDFGFRRGLTTPSGFNYSFTPDSIGRMSQANLSGNGLSSLTMAEYRYSGSRPVNRIHRLWTGSDRFETAYGYNAQRFLTQLETKYGDGNPPDATVFSQTLVRDLVGRIREDQQTLADLSLGNKYSYDPFDRLDVADLGVSTFDPNPTVARSLDYDLDDAQNRTLVTETVGAQITPTTYQVATNSNEYTSVGSNLYTHDGNGNLISDGYYYYVYDYLDRLSEVYVITYPAGATSSTTTKTAIYTHETQKKREGKATKLTKAKADRLVGQMRARVQKEIARVHAARKTATKKEELLISSSVNDGLTLTVDEPVLEFVAYYGYDSFNRRVFKASLYESTWYAYDGWRLIEEYDAGGNPTVAYFDGIGIDEHLGMARYDASGWIMHGFVQDQIGNVVRVTDASGSVIARFEYDPYGNRTLVQGSPGFNIAYGFTGRYHDIETDLIYFRNRYYSPNTGRFITQDPIGIWGDGANLGSGFAFGANAGLTAADPLGLQGWEHLSPVRYIPTGGGDFPAGPQAPPLYSLDGRKNHIVQDWFDGKFKPGYTPSLGTLINSAPPPKTKTSDPAVEFVLLLTPLGELRDTVGYWNEGSPCKAIGSSVFLIPGGGKVLKWGLKGLKLGAKGVGKFGGWVWGKIFGRAAKGGRLGSASTRAHVSDVASEMERRGFTITGGGGRLPEEYLPGPGGARRGSSFPDITATKNGRTVRVNTVDALVDGVTPSAREARIAARIRSQTPGDHLLLIPKPRR